MFNNCRVKGKFFKHLKAPSVSFSSFTGGSRGCGCDQKKKKRVKGAGGAEWKTSDFVVTLIKEQQVPVCLSAQAVNFSFTSM